MEAHWGRINEAALRECQSDYQSKWQRKGFYYPVGPVVVVDDHFSKTEHVNIFTRPVVVHELLHHWHILGSTIGVFYLFLEQATTQVHLNFKRASRSVPLNQPFLKVLLDKEIDSLTEETVGSVLNILYVRKLFSGYQPVEQTAYFPTSLLEATNGFKQVYEAIFPCSNAPFEDLDGRFWGAEKVDAAPKYYLGNWYIGSEMIYEGLAIMLQRASTDPSKLPDSFPFSADVDPYRDNASEAIDSGIPSLYNGFGFLLLNELSRRGVTAATRGKKPGLLETFLAFAELALNPAILPCQMALWKRRPAWHDLHPGYRYCNLCYCVYRIGLCPKLDGPVNEWHDHLIRYMEGAAAYMDWPSYRDTLEAWCSHAQLAEKETVFMGQGIRASQTLSSAKLKDLASYMFGRVGLGLEGNCSPVAIIGKGVYAELQKPLGTAMFPALLSAVVNDFYFAESFDTAGTFLRPFDNKSRRQLSEELEEVTAISGISQALLRCADSHGR